METLDLVKIIAGAASEKKATQIVAQNLANKSGLCDYQIICSGSNERQTQAISSHIEELLRGQKLGRPYAIEGKQTGHWILMDYGNILVHVFLDTIRDFYALDKLWTDADTMMFDEPKA